MAKYSFEFKKKVVNSYLNGEGSFEFVAKKYEILTCTNVKTWVRNYKNFGDEGLFRSRKNELYLSSEISYQDLALQEGITTPSMIANWVNRFRAAGPDALRPHKCYASNYSSHLRQIYPIKNSNMLVQIGML